MHRNGAELALPPDGVRTVEASQLARSSQTLSLASSRTKFRATACGSTLVSTASALTSADATETELRASDRSAFRTASGSALGLRWKTSLSLRRGDRSDSKSRVSDSVGVRLRSGLTTAESRTRRRHSLARSANELELSNARSMTRSALRAR